MTTLTAVRSQHAHDMLLPIACDTCAPARLSTAKWEITFDRLSKAEWEEVRWHVCAACFDTCAEAAIRQNQGITPPTFDLLPDAVEVAA